MKITVPISDGALQVEREGAGAPLLLVHGFPLDHRMWREQIGPLAKTHDVLAPDLRGFGGSLVSPGVVTMERMADDLAEMLIALGIVRPVIFCGLSMGGYVAWQFFLRHRPKLAALILCDTKAAADTPDAAALRHRAAEQVRADGPEAIAEAMHHRMFAAHTRDHRPEITEFIRETILGTSREGIAAAQLGMAQRLDATSLLGKIDVPTLLVVGSEDRISPVGEMRAMAAAIPRAEFVEIDGAGHMAPLESPGPVNEAMEAFLRRLG